MPQIASDLLSNINAVTLLNYITVEMVIFGWITMSIYQFKYW